MWEISNVSQAYSFLLSVCLGFLFCIFYDAFRAVRYTVNYKSAMVFLQDIIYFLLISFVTFIFLLIFTNGEIRGYVIFGIVLGFIICFYTFSKLTLIFFKFIFGLLFAIFGKINLCFNLLINNTNEFITKIFNIIKNTYKKGLKKVKGLLYTKK